MTETCDDCDRPRAGTSRYCSYHKQANRNKPRRCLCGCGQSCSNHSKYASDECRWRVAYDKRKISTFVKCEEPGCNKPRHGRDRYCLDHCKHIGHKTCHSTLEEKQMVIGVHKKQRGATVYYSECSLPDNMSKAKCQKYLSEGAFMPGDKIYLDGVMIEVTPRGIQDDTAKQLKLLV